MDVNVVFDQEVVRSSDECEENLFSLRPIY